MPQPTPGRATAVAAGLAAALEKSMLLRWATTVEVATVVALLRRLEERVRAAQLVQVRRADGPRTWIIGRSSPCAQVLRHPRHCRRARARCATLSDARYVSRRSRASTYTSYRCTARLVHRRRSRGSPPATPPSAPLRVGDSVAKWRKRADRVDVTGEGRGPATCHLLVELLREPQRRYQQVDGGHTNDRLNGARTRRLGQQRLAPAPGRGVWWRWRPAGSGASRRRGAKDRRGQGH